MVDTEVEGCFKDKEKLTLGIMGRVYGWRNDVESTLVK